MDGIQDRVRDGRDVTLLKEVPREEVSKLSVYTEKNKAIAFIEVEKCS